MQEALNEPSTSVQPARRRWSLDEQPLLLPTDSLDYVLLERRDVVTPPLAPAFTAAYSEQRSSLQPIQRLPRPIVQPAPAANLLEGLIETRPLRRLGPALPTNRRLPMAAPPSMPAPLLRQRSQAREASVQRLRRKVQRADLDLAAALRQSELAAAHFTPPLNSTEEEAQLAEACRQSAEEQLALQQAAAAAEQQSEAISSAAGGSVTSGSAAIISSVAGSSSSDDSSSERADETAAEKAAAEKAAAEEARQMELAVAESLKSDEQRRADIRHDEESTLHGIIDSLKDREAVGIACKPQRPPSSVVRRSLRGAPAESAAAAAAARAAASARFGDGTDISSRQCQAGAAAEEVANAGRDMARRILESHLAGGGGLS